MTSKPKRKMWPRATALALAALLLTPLLAVSPVQARAGSGPTATVRAMTAKQKVVALAGAALLYYLYKKHQAKQNVAATAAGTNSQPQLYRSKNGGVYYRDPRTHQPIWLTVSRQPVQVPAADLQRYAPDYSQYQGQPAPTAPSGFRTRPFSAFESAALAGPHGPTRSR